MDARRLKMLAQVLVEPMGEERCRACLDHLDAYVEAQLAGQAYRALFPVVAQHLDRCVACAEGYARMYEARLAEAVIAVPATKRVPDLRFLLPEGAADKRVTPTQLRARLRTDRFRNTLSERVSHVAGRLRLQVDHILLDVLPPPPQRGMAFRDASEAPPVLEFAVDSPDETITQLNLRVYDERTPALQTIRCTVAMRDREWPDLDEIAVRLSWDSEQRETHTDAWGEAVFQHVPAEALGHMAIEVAPA